MVETLRRHPIPEARCANKERGAMEAAEDEVSSWMREWAVPRTVWMMRSPNPKEAS